MGLSNAVQGARYIPQQITWTDEDGTAVNLTGATLTGKLKNMATGGITSNDGTLAIGTAPAGIFSWTYGSLDGGTVGNFSVQFIATYAGPLTEKTLTEPWRVYDAFD